jgi:hypothetical protein
MYTMFIIMELLYDTGGKKGKENDESTKPKCITSVQVEDINVNTESC